MHKSKISTHSIFETCILNRDLYEKHSAIFETPPLEVIAIVKDNKKYTDSISKFLASKEGKVLSQKWLLLTLRRTLIDCKDICDSNIDARVKRFEDNLSDLKIAEYKVVKNFYGATLNRSEFPIRFGDLTVYELPRHENELVEQLPFGESSGFRNVNNTRTVIQCVVRCRDPSKALELANNAFNSFEMLMAFLLGEENVHFSKGILRMRFAPYQNATIASEGWISLGDEINNNYNGDFEISTLQEYLPNNRDFDLDYLIIMVLSPKNELEKKICMAIEWIGEAYSDSNRSSSYLKAVISLEALLKKDEKSVISPSIMSSIAEQCAYLNGRSAEECLNVEKKIKEIYSERSKIAHTGSSSVSLQSLVETRELVRHTILNFTAYAKNFNLESTDAFQKRLRIAKYELGGLIRA